MHIKIGSRQSALAQFQARSFASHISANDTSEFFFRASMGDLNLDVDLAKTQSKGVFTQDFNDLLKSKEVDCVVHSWKDLPIEDNGVTSIKATLEREDHRDILFLKKSSFNQAQWKVLTSSPRREYLVTDFIKNYIPTGSNKKLSFKALRGNIPTRLSKFRDDKESDVYITAVAALKRLYTTEYHKEINELFENCLWCILPSKEFPHAAAQGAIAVESLNSNVELNSKLEKLNHKKTFDDVSEERRIHQSYGGGCHLKLGVSIDSDEHGKITHIKGYVDGQEKNETTFNPNWSVNKVLREETYVLSDGRTDVLGNSSDTNSFFNRSDDHSQSSKEALKYLNKNIAICPSRAHCSSYFDNLGVWPVENVGLKFNGTKVLWTPGLYSWKKLAAKGYWVNGSFESRGANEAMGFEFLNKKFTKVYLTHQQAPKVEGYDTIPVYTLDWNEEEIKSADLSSFKYFYWMSASSLKVFLKHHPNLKSKTHFVGLGRSYKILTKTFPEIKFLPCLDVKWWRKNVCK